ncbi:hypothetical protein [Psychrobacillus sp. OK032]|uniref:hypothetical protein n=1 Tax=Psychrobacillus sp. OK032 TaxID=1884358 RepID=UPI0008B10BEF|nr:hypothetical protein [Psychrobacillus sp. OK032]SES34605.1 hypothetical protein SAMN05518872_108148 [Psychrobacillus sp. OK032]
MTNWIPGAGFYVVQPSGPINEIENEQILEEVKRKLDEAKEAFAPELLEINYLNA